MVSDVGRRFRATRVLEIVIELTEDDVADQNDAGEDAYDSARLIAGCTPEQGWTVVGDDVIEIT